jgi:ADP-ribosylglycohydrolase
MLGAIIGDIAGALFEFSEIGSVPYDFDLFAPNSTFTDDSVLTCAIADAILKNREYADSLREYALKYPNRGYGTNFNRWILSHSTKPLNSFGNGAAMRVSPVGWAFDTLEKTLEEAKKSATMSHNHPEGIKGAQATAVAIYLARNKKTKLEIQKYISETFGYSISKSFSELKASYHYNEICQETVPASLICFFEGSDFESCLRLSISLGGDTDTQAAITGAIAEAYYGIPDGFEEAALKYLPSELIEIITEFRKKFIRRPALKNNIK